MKSLLALLLPALFFAGHVYATPYQELTQTVKGRVLDAQSQAPVFGATVIVLGTDPIQGAVTDPDGHFKIEKVAIGRHSIQVSFIGYENKVVPEVLVGSAKEVWLDIQITESFTRMEELVIVATRQNKGEPLNDFATVSAKSFNVEETSRYAATFDDPARAALSFAGVRGGGNDIENEIVIRGNSPRSILWRVEGVEVPNPNHYAEEGASSGGISILSNNMLSTSDFYTGAFPAEYGNALSGVFDINLRKGNADNREYAFQVGVLGIALAAEGPFSDNSQASYLVNYRYSTLSLLDGLGLLPIFGESTLTFQDLAFKTHFPTKNAGSFSFWGMGGKSFEINRANAAEQMYFNTKFLSGMGVLGLSHVYFLNPNTYIESKLTASAAENGFERDSLKLREYYHERFVKKDLRWSTMINTKFNARNTLRSGFIVSSLGYDMDAEFLRLEDDQRITLWDSKGSMLFTQLFSQWQHRLTEKFTVNTGFHYSRLFLNGQQALEPRLGFLWKATPVSTFNAGFGMHSRLESPSIYLSFNDTGEEERAQLNKGLEITKAAHAVIGYERKLGDGMRLKAESYYQYLYDVPIRPTSATDEWSPTYSAVNALGVTSEQLVNDGTGRNYGLELSAEKILTNGLYYLGNVSLFESLYTPADGVERNTRYNGNYTVNLSSGKEFTVGRRKSHLLGINIRVIYAGGNRKIPIDLAASIAEQRTVYNYTNAFEERLADYARLDFGVNYRINKPRISSVVSLNVQNATARKNAYFEYFETATNTVETYYQLGFLPNFSYRVEF